MQGATFGRYRLLEVLGSGGMGEVWRARDTVINRDVAIKVLHPAFATDPAFENRFRREALAAAQLNSPHVVPIHNFGEIDGRLFVDMRLIEGRDLTSVIDDGPLDPSRAAHIVRQIASALDAAHRAGLIHRDVKPSNIMLSADDYAYLIDFGIAHVVADTRLTGTGNAIGTLAYMAPERFTGAPLDPSCDIYALACVLYECLTGRLPFDAKEPGQLIAAHLSTPPPRPSDVLPELPRGLDAVVATGMAKEPGDRYGTARELAGAATAVLASPTAPRPAPPRPDDHTPAEASPALAAPTHPDRPVATVFAPTRSQNKPTRPDDPPARPNRAAPPRRRVRPGAFAALAVAALALIAVLVLLFSQLFSGGRTVDPTTTTTRTTTTTTGEVTTTTTTNGRTDIVYKDCNGQRVPETQACPAPSQCPEEATPQNGACLCPEGTTVERGGTCPKPLDCPEGSTASGGTCVCADDGSTVQPGGECPRPLECPTDSTASGGSCVCDSDGSSVSPGGSCPLPEPCPTGTTGTPPNCEPLQSTAGSPPQAAPPGTASRRPTRTNASAAP